MIDVLRRRVDEKATASNNARSMPNARTYTASSVVTSKIDPKDIPDVAKRINFTDVTSHGIGIICTDRNENREYNSVILPANTPVPASKEQYYFTTKEYQEKISIQVTQGEDEDVRYVSVIGTSEIEIAPRREFVKIRVTISCDENSIIHVRVFDMNASRDLGEMFIDRVSNLSRQEIQKNKEKINRLDISGV